jgi:hypothetical protein
LARENKYFRWFTPRQSGLPDFSCYNLPKRGRMQYVPNNKEIFQMTIQYTKWPYNIPDGRTIYQMAVKYARCPYNRLNGSTIYQIAVGTIYQIAVGTIYQIAIIYINIFHRKTLQNYPKRDFWFENISSGNHAATMYRHRIIIAFQWNNFTTQYSRDCEWLIEPVINYSEHSSIKCIAKFCGRHGCQTTALAKFWKVTQLRAVDTPSIHYLSSCRTIKRFQQSRVTRWICKKITQNVAQAIFSQI